MVDDIPFQTESCSEKKISKSENKYLPEKCEALALHNKLDCIWNEDTEKIEALCRVVGCLTRMEVLLRCKCDNDECSLHMNTINVQIDPSSNLCFGLEPIINEEHKPIAPSKVEKCSQIENPEFGEWNCKDSTCKLRCQDGYWTPQRTYQCNCVGEDCNWTGKNRINSVKCVEAKCPDLMKDEKISDWSCSGRSNWDICWAPCKAGSL